MEVNPPRWLETIVRQLVPPACREHVLGDLSERYTSPRQYVVDALRTLPFVIASQIRRTSDPLRLVMHALVTFGVFGGLSSRPDAADSLAWLRAAVPTVAVAIALVLRDAYRSLNPRTSRGAAVDATVAVACALLSQAALAVARPQWLLGPWTALGGSAGAFVMVFLMRSAMPVENKFGTPLAVDGTTSIDDFVRDVRRFEQRIHQRNRREVLAGVLVVAGFGAFFWRGPEFVTRIGCGLAMAGALFIIYRIRTRGVANPVPTNVALSTSMAMYQRELERQRDLLQTVTWWYLLPLFPGMAVLMIGQAFARSQPAPALRAFGLFLLVGFLTRQLNHRAARKLQRKIDGLTAALAKEES